MQRDAISCSCFLHFPLYARRSGHDCTREICHACGCVPASFSALIFSTAAEADQAEKEKNIDPVSEDETALDTASELPSDSDPSDSLEESTESGILAKLKEFPDLGEHGAGLLQLAEESLGISASKLELGKIVPMLLELQKNVHEHYGKGLLHLLIDFNFLCWQITPTQRFLASEVCRPVRFLPLFTFSFDKGKGKV